MATRVIEIQMDEGERMRRVVSRSNCRVTGKYPSFRKRAMAYWESPIEHDAFRRLDADELVVSFLEQPARIVYEVDGVRRVHYPDILVRWLTGGKTFVEIKSDRDAASPDIVERTRIMERLLPPLGFGYRLWPAHEIQIQPRLDNEIYLLRHAMYQVQPQTLERLRQLFLRESIIRWDALIDRALAPNGLFPACRLIIEGWLIIDHDLPLGPETAVRFNFSKGQRA